MFWRHTVAGIKASPLARRLKHLAQLQCVKDNPAKASPEYNSSEHNNSEQGSPWQGSQEQGSQEQGSQEQGSQEQGSQEQGSSGPEHRRGRQRVAVRVRP